MKTALIIHGIGGHAGIHWQQWLNEQLTAEDYQVLMPNLPNPNHPDRKTWLTEIKKTLSNTKLNELTIIGHSLGVTTALDFIEEADGPIDGLLSVSGFAKDYGAALNSYFLSQKSIDFDKVKSKVRWAAVVYGDNDPYVTQAALKYVADALGLSAIIVPNGGHLNTEAGFTKFPRLIDILSEVALP